MKNPPRHENAPRHEPITGAASATAVKWLVNGVWVLFFTLGLSFLLVREVLVPRVHEYRPEIVAALEQVIGRPVAIDALTADWQGLRPRLQVSGLSILDADGTVALHLERVDATVAWRSLLWRQPRLHQLTVFAPDLALRREADGQVFVAGIPVGSQGHGSGFTDWLFDQREVVIHNAKLNWTDRQRAAPELRLDAVDFRLSVLGSRYRFGLKAVLPAAEGDSIELKGDLVSERPADPASWSGQVFMALAQVDLGALAQWVDYPIPLAGVGELRAWGDIADGEAVAIVTDIALTGVDVQLDDERPPLQLDLITGRVTARRIATGFEVSARALELKATDQLRIGPLDFDLALSAGAARLLESGQFSASMLDVGALATLASHVPLSDVARERLTDFAPGGVLEDVRAQWQGLGETAPQWTARARFSDLALSAFDLIPGVSKLTGEFAGDQDRGRFTLNSRDVAVDMPRVFAQPVLEITTLQGEGGWVRRDQQLEFVLDDLRFENADATGSASGLYRIVPGGRGEIDVAARLTRAEATAVWRYLPLTVGPNTRDWLRAALTGGTVPDARFRLKGDLNDFPFAGGVAGQFLVTVRVADGTLNYGQGWPGIERINGEVRFDGPGMQIRADSAHMLGVDLADVVASVPDLGLRGGQIMTINGRAQGATRDFLRFVSASPVQGYIGGFTDGIVASGNGALDLTLTIPLHHIPDTEVSGEYRFARNRLDVMEGLIPLTNARGRVLFSEDSLSIVDARATAFGEPLTVTASTQAEGGVRFTVQGGVSMRALRETYDWPVLSHLSGSSVWAAQVDVRKEQVSVQLDSALDGISSSLPQPMNKRSVDRWPLSARIDFSHGGMREHVQLELLDRLGVELFRQRRGAEWEVIRGGVGLFAPVEMAQDGVMLTAQLDVLDLDVWRDIIGSAPQDGSLSWLADASDVAGRLRVRIGDLRAFGTTLSPFALDARSDQRGWQGQVSSDQVTGDFHWAGADGGALHARFEQLVVGTAHGEVGREPVEEKINESPGGLPALDIVAERFLLRGKDMGRLVLKATNANRLWTLHTLALENADGQLNGSGQWRAGADPLTELTFSIESADIGKLMTRLGYPAVFSGGSTLMQGRTAWRGSPLRIDHPSLSGHLALEARGGQFRKLDPGVGRLLGVLSLQSLPRRLTLDFRDVFSEGFAFDLISGSISMTSGVMSTDDLEIIGPAARVWVEGTSHLERETQDLRVIVQPTLTESVAVGAAAGLINPVAGVVVYLAQRVLSDPIERMFAFSYAITGSWSDPNVEKLSGGDAPTDARIDGGAVN